MHLMPDVLLYMQSSYYLAGHGYIFDIAEIECGRRIGISYDDLLEKFPDIQLLFIESGGDKLSATFSPELVDATIFVIDVAEGDKIPRKGGPGITKSDLLVINKIDIAPYVGADLKVMERDSKRMRGDKPFIFTNVRGDEGIDEVEKWIKRNVLLEDIK